MEPKRQIVSVSDSKGETLTLTLHWDSNIEEWVHIFETILKWLTFSDGTIKELFPDE